MNGNVVEGHLEAARRHATCTYAKRRTSWGGAMHSTYATSFAALGRPIPAPDASCMVGGDPMAALPPSAADRCRSSGPSARPAPCCRITRLYHRRLAAAGGKMAIEVEEIAKITHLAMLMGQPLLLSREQLAETGQMYQTVYGQR